MKRALTQTTLDTAFNGSVYVFWQRKTGDLNEYIVYTQSGTDVEYYADDEPFVKSTNIVVRYYYRVEDLGTQTGRALIKSREAAIQTAMEAAGFEVEFGPYDAGGIDDIGYNASVFEFVFGEAV